MLCINAKRAPLSGPTQGVRGRGATRRPGRSQRQDVVASSSHGGLLLLHQMQGMRAPGPLPACTHHHQSAQGQSFRSGGAASHRERHRIMIGPLSSLSPRLRMLAAVQAPLRCAGREPCHRRLRLLPRRATLCTHARAAPRLSASAPAARHEALLRLHALPAGRRRRQKRAERGADEEAASSGGASIPLLQGGCARRPVHGRGCRHVRSAPRSAPIAAAGPVELDPQAANCIGKLCKGKELRRT